MGRFKFRIKGSERRSEEIFSGVSTLQGLGWVPLCVCLCLWSSQVFSLSHISSYLDFFLELLLCLVLAHPWTVLYQKILFSQAVSIFQCY